MVFEKRQYAHIDFHVAMPHNVEQRRLNTFLVQVIVITIIMLEQLFGSRTRIKLLRLFLGNPEREYFVRELTRLIDERINSVRRELANLESIGLVKSLSKDKKRFYQVNDKSPVFEEMRALIL